MLNCRQFFSRRRSCWNSVGVTIPKIRDIRPVFRYNTKQRGSCYGRIGTVQRCPVWARERCRISPPRFRVECCKRQLNQGSFVLLYFRLFTFSALYWVCLSVFSCTVFFVSISQVIGCKDRLRNDLGYTVSSGALNSTPSNCATLVGNDDFSDV